MSFYPNNPAEPPQQRSPWLVTIVLVGLVLAVILVLWNFYLGGIGLRIAPSPTPTATSGVPASATPDFRSTTIAEDRATELAYQAVMTMQTPVQRFLPNVQFGENETATAVNLNLVPVGGEAGNTGDTPTPLPAVGVETPTPIPPVDVILPTPLDDGNPDSPLQPPVDVPAVIESETPTPSETPFLPTETFTPSPTITPTPPPTPFQMETLRAVILPTLTAQPVWLRLAPMNTFTPVSTLMPGTEIRLLGRDGPGEWVYICCVENGQPRWIRQAYAPPRNNTLPTEAPPSATPDDVRWLPTEPWPGNYPRPAEATPIPANDFPRFRREASNSGRVPLAFGGQLANKWPIPAQVPQRWTTAVAVVDQYVLAASADGNIYGIDHSLGNQIWSFPVGAQVSRPLTVVDRVVYFADDSGRAFALPLGTGSTTWQKNLAVPSITEVSLPATGFVADRDHLFIGVRNENKYYIVQYDRAAGGALRYFDLGAIAPQELAIGNQLLYVAAAQVWALDIDNLELVWSRSDLYDLTAPPVYTPNGVTRLTELYVATRDGRVHELDATTGVELHTYEGTELVTGLAVDENRVFASGNAYIKAFDRRNNSQVWRSGANGDSVGGALVTPNQLIVVSATGVIQLVNPPDGALTSGGYVQSAVSKMPAVSGPLLYVPGDDGKLYAFTQ